MPITVVDTFEEFIALEEAWNNLYEKCERSTIFSSWEWMRTWWEVYKDQGQRQLLIMCCYDKDSLVGIAPFQIDSSFPKSIIQGKTLRFIGTGELRKDNIITQYLDFIVLPEMEDMMVESISQCLLDLKNKWDFADFEYLLNDALIFKCFNNNKEICKRKVDYGYKFSVSGFGDFDEYLTTMGKRWRKMYAKKSRLLHRDGKVTTEITTSRKDVKPFLDQLANMHCSRWKNDADDCIFSSDRFSLFHEKILERLLPEKKAYIKTIKLSGNSLASYYVFSDKHKNHYYQSGFHTEFANKYSPLFLLVCNEIGAAIKNKEEFDFMYADNVDSYKRQQYAANYEPMYRLKWSTNPIRFVAFNCAKSIQNKTMCLKKFIKRN